ncbi:MOSC domain-containing protein [Rhodobacter capsulatus]|uniref:MOSC domain-containing protein n=1 Tax=Rhodobacter capsulatus TaxID=1061 RepID=UPI00114262AF|nr:MOSC domain-containing protein [Rhodobacter capsulatus]TQD36171.1 MOSC domain-containing protein [Rhodobacter capsulatus]
MTGRLTHIVRHPIKSIGYEDIKSAPLMQGRVLPFDRVWAVSHQAAKFDSPLGAWARKMNFLRGVAAPKLMAVQARLRPDGQLDLTHPERPALTVDPDQPGDQARLIDWLTPLWPETRPAPRAVERVEGVALADMAEPYVSLLSLSSLGALGQAAGREISRHRFRGNLWVEGWAPWAERDLVGKRLRLGAAVLEVAMPITRCRATCTDPATGTEDLEMLDLLERLHGDWHFGCYATVIESGTITLGDPVEVL